MKKKFVMYLAVVAVFSFIVSAALVNYLNETSYVDVHVTSPMRVEATWDVNIVGGETTRIQLIIKNKANVDIVGNEQYYINNDAGIEVSDFSFSLDRNDSRTLPLLWTKVNDTTLQLNSEQFTWNAYEVVNVTMFLTMNQSALGVYEFEGKVMV